jgi:hypothetical protein
MKRKFQLAFMAALLLTATLSKSQTNGIADKATNQLKLLLQFNGFWETKEAVMKAAGKEYRFAYYADFKTASANNAILMHEWADIPGVGKLDGNNLAGVSTYDGKIHWYSVDNMGTTHEHIGEFSDATHFTMIHKSTQDGKEFIETLQMEFPKPGILTLKQTSTLDGEETVAISGTFHRTKKPEK